MSCLIDDLRAIATFLEEGFQATETDVKRIRSAADEINLLQTKRKRYFRCECGGLIVRSESNKSPCEVCGLPLGKELCVDVHLWIEAQNAKAEIERLTRERDEAREAARELLGRTEFFEDENRAIEKYPWLEYHA